MQANRYSNVGLVAEDWIHFLGGSMYAGFATGLNEPVCKPQIDVASLAV